MRGFRMWMSNHCWWLYIIAFCMNMYGIYSHNNQEENDMVIGETPVLLTIQNKQYVTVMVGNPGTYHTLRLRFGVSDIYLYTTPSTYSDTYSRRYRTTSSLRNFNMSSGGAIPLQSPSLASANVYTEVFYFDTVKIRLPVIYGQPTSSDGDPSETTERIQHHGVLGLGPSSPLWNYWYSWTWSKYHLSLGRVISMDTPRQFKHHQIHSLDGLITIGTSSGSTNYALIPSLHRDISLLPIGMFKNVSSAIDRSNNRRTKTSLLRFLIESVDSFMSMEGYNQTDPMAGPLVNFWSYINKGRSNIHESGFLLLTIDTLSTITLDSNKWGIQLVKPCAFCEQTDTGTIQHLNGTVYLGWFHCTDLVIGRNLITGTVTLWQVYDADPDITQNDMILLVIVCLLVFCIWYPLMYESSHIQQEYMNILPPHDTEIEYFNYIHVHEFLAHIALTGNMDPNQFILDRNLRVSYELSLDNNNLRTNLEGPNKASYVVNSGVFYRVNTGAFNHADKNILHPEDIPPWLTKIFPSNVITIYHRVLCSQALLLSRLTIGIVIITSIFTFNTEMTMDTFSYGGVNGNIVFRIIICLLLGQYIYVNVRIIQLYSDIWVIRLAISFLACCWLVQVNGFKNQVLGTSILFGLSCIICYLSASNFIFILFNGRSNTQLYSKKLIPVHINVADVYPSIVNVSKTIYLITDSRWSWWMWVITCGLEFIGWSWFLCWYNLPLLVNLIWPSHPVISVLSALTFVIIPVASGLLSFISQTLNMIHIRLSVSEQIVKKIKQSKPGTSSNMTNNHNSIGDKDSHVKQQHLETKRYYPALSGAYSDAGMQRPISSDIRYRKTLKYPLNNKEDNLIPYTPDIET